MPVGTHPTVLYIETPALSISDVQSNYSIKLKRDTAYRLQQIKRYTRLVGETVPVVLMNKKICAKSCLTDGVVQIFCHGQTVIIVRAA